MAIQRADLNIHGMSDKEGAEKIEARLSQLDGVQSVTVNFPRNRVIIGYDDEKIDFADLVEELEEAGYELLEEEE